MALKAGATKWHYGMKQNGMKKNTLKGKTKLMILSSRAEQYDVLINKD